MPITNPMAGRHNLHVLTRRGRGRVRKVEASPRSGGGNGMGSTRRLTILLAAALAMLMAGSAPAGAAMHSTKLADGTCETTGGGRFVPIPGFPGERIDRRLLADIAWLKRRYPLFITDGYSLDPVHASNGEHPLGLALDIVPDTELGGTWAQITALARWAEPRRDRPRFPFRWVGYTGDSGHGPRHHLHLSWSHSESTKGPGFPVRTVYTLRCPTSAPPTTTPPPPPSGSAMVEEGSGGGGKNGGKRHHGDGQRDDRNDHGPTGGANAGGGSSSGGVAARLDLAPVVPESG